MQVKFWCINIIQFRDTCQSTADVCSPKDVIIDAIHVSLRGGGGGGGGGGGVYATLSHHGIYVV